MGKPVGVIVGNTVAALSVEAVYNVAHRLVSLEPDSASLDRLAQKSSKNGAIISDSSLLNASCEVEQTLTDVEERATLVVLLHKLLVTQSGIRPFLPQFLTEVLRLGFSLEVPAADDDASVMLALVRRIYRVKLAYKNREETETSKDDATGSGSLKDFSAIADLKTSLKDFGDEDFGVTEEELAAIVNSSAASLGIAAVAFHVLSSIVPVADAIAAMSCEALLASTESFEADLYRMNTCPRRLQTLHVIFRASSLARN